MILTLALENAPGLFASGILVPRLHAGKPIRWPLLTEPTTEVEMSQVRAKFHVTEVGQNRYGGKVVLEVVSRGEDNKQWAQATPTGQITMSIKNEMAFEVFHIGDEFFVDFTPAPKGQEGM